MNVEYTEQQKDAIGVRNSSVIVSAAAGSGKTAVLTERLAHILADTEKPVRADRIVVVTFANDAAAEMKTRLESKLAELINERPGDKHLLEQQVLLQNAKISTINSFCFDLLRDNISDDFGITSGFSIIEPSDENVIKAQAMEELFDYYSHEDYETLSALYDSFCFSDKDDLIDVIKETDKFLESVKIDEDWLDKVEKEYKKDFEHSIYCKSFFRYTEKEVVELFQRFESNTNKLRIIFKNIEDAPFHFSMAEEDRDCIKMLVRIIEENRIPTKEETVKLKLSERLKSVSKKLILDDELYDDYKHERSDIKKEFNKILSDIGMVYDNFRETGEIVELLVRVVRKYREIVLEKKFSKNVLCFADGENLILQLLADKDGDKIIPTEIARNIAENFDVIMLDEYQDTSSRQDLIFKLISHNYKHDENGSEMYGDNVFLVGDVKQSIYRFRLANPKNFINTMESSVPYKPESDSKNQSIFLNKNFRSSPEVIDFVNFVFSEIMSKECGDIDYNDDEKLYFGAKDYAEIDTGNRLTHFMMIDTDPVSDTEEVMKNPEAEAIADKIAEMIENKVKVLEKGVLRDCKPSDFCILVRNNACIKDYVNALTDREVYAKGKDESGYLKSQEITVLINLLKVIANPLQDVPLTAVMLSPMYTFSIEDIAYIKSFVRKKSRDNPDRKKLVYQLIIEAVNGELENFDTALAEKCRDFLKSIEKFRLDAVTMTTGELINSIYDTTDFISVMQIHKDGDKKRANLRMLIQYAQNYETFAAVDGRGGLTGFLRHIDRVSGEEGDYSQGKSSAASGDYVKIMTLHKSKGLEFPFVFICEMESSLGMKKIEKLKIMFSDDGRIGFKICNKKLMQKYKTFQYKMLQNEEFANKRSEEMRLLYVGMTRAKQQLFISLRCGDKQREKVQELARECFNNNSEIRKSVMNAEKFSEWLWLCLMMHGDFPAIADKVGIDLTETGIPACDTEEHLFNFEYIANTDIKKETAESKMKTKNADDKIVSEIIDIMNTDYDMTLAQTTAKLSVTQISKKFSATEEFDFHLQRPKFISEKRKMTGSERGTAIHTFFQYCDFGRASADVPSEVHRLVDMGQLTKAQAECIEPSKVTAFFESNLYKRIISAKSYERERKFTVTSEHIKQHNPQLIQLQNTDNMIKGIVDIMFEETDGIVVVDYKSDRGISANGLRERYEKQLLIYKSAVEIITGKKVKELVIYSIELKKTIIL